MRITQLRNATIILHIGRHNILVDPMLAPKDALPPLRLLDGARFDLIPADGETMEFASLAAAG